MKLKIKKRRKLTYYYERDNSVLSALVTEEQIDGDLRYRKEQERIRI